MVLVRHGETQWSRTGRHTGRTDVALTELGQRQADALGSMLRGRPFAAVMVSPLQRAAETLRLASLDVARVRVLEELVEWDYGDYEGLTTEQIRRSVWLLRARDASLLGLECDGHAIHFAGR
jgi:probable phosphoglycerate mutase